MSDLPGGLTARPALLEDAEAVRRLIAEGDLGEYGAPDLELEEIEADWARPSFDPARDTRLVFEEGGTLVGWGELWADGTAEIRVHPDHRGRGISTHLLAWAEDLAGQRRVGTEGRVVVRPLASETDPVAHRLLHATGYHPARQVWRLEIRLGEPPPPAELLSGCSLRLFRRGVDDHEVHAVIEEAFSAWGGRDPLAFEEWAAFSLRRASFDASLWFVVEDGSRVVGAEWCTQYPTIGWVEQIAVRPSHQGRGIGTALLRHAFAELFARGERVVGLATDSRTGALDLYLRLGMRVTREYTRYEKELIPEP